MFWPERYNEHAEMECRYRSHTLDYPVDKLKRFSQEVSMSTPESISIRLTP